MIQSGSVPTDPPPEATAEGRILLMEETEKRIVQEVNQAELKLECPKCLSKGGLNSQGVGGSATTTAHRQIQMGCGNCKSKTVLRLVLEHNAELIKCNANVVELQKQLMNLKDSIKTRGRAESTGTKRLKLSSKERSKERPITGFLSSAMGKSPVLSVNMDMEMDESPTRPENSTASSRFEPARMEQDETTIQSLREIITELKEELKAQRELNKCHLEMISQLNDTIKTLRDPAAVQENAARGGNRINKPPARGMNYVQRQSLSWADEIDNGEFPELPTFRDQGGRAAVQKNAALGGNRINKPPANSMFNMNYASKVVNGKPRRLSQRDKKLIERATTPRPEPVEFDRVRFKINSSIFSKYKGREKYYIARQLLKTIGLGSKRNEKSKYFDLSLVGNSIIELYVPRPGRDSVIDILRARNLEIISAGMLDLPEHSRISQETARNYLVSRLSVLYKRASLIRLKECILRGVPEDLQQMIVNKANTVLQILEENDGGIADTEMALNEPEPTGHGSQ